MGKKVQKNFLMGLKIWWSLGSSFFFSKSSNIGRVLIFHAKLQFFDFRLKRIPIFFKRHRRKNKKKKTKEKYKEKLLLQNFSFLGRWVVFLSKKRHFFHAKLQFLRGWVLFLSKKTTIFRYFLENEGGSRWAPGAIPACVDGEYQPSVSHRYRLPSPLVVKCWWWGWLWNEMKANFGSSIRMKLLYVIGGVLT